MTTAPTNPTFAIGPIAWKSLKLAFAAFAATAFLTCAATAQVAVTDSGTPSYSQAIGVPPGIAGMSPKIGISYAGGGVNGPVGYGWSIQGVSSISRCPAIKAIDGVKAGVAFGPNDKLCLDGQRLIQVNADGSVPAFPQTSDSAGGSGLVREYRTEKDSYARIRSYGTAPGDASGASGPAYFKVWTKSGQIYEYGASPSATSNTNALIVPNQKTVAVVWAVSRISDTLGNFIDFKYEQRTFPWGSGGTSGSSTPGREWNVLEIQYSGNKVVFNYSDRPDGAPNARSDRAEAWHLGSKNVSVRRLNSITTYVNASPSSLGPGNGVAVKTTKLGYVNGAISGRSLVATIRECAGDANSTRCLPPTTFGYADGGSDAYQLNSNFGNSALSAQQMISTDNTVGTLTGDFDGDGKTDLLRWGNAASGNQMWLSNGDGTFRQFVGGAVDLTTVQLFSSDGCYNTVVADFNGDGVADLLRTLQATNNSGGGCPSGPNLLYIGNGDGSFKTPVALTGIDLSTVKEVYSRIYVSCEAAAIPLRDGDRLAMADIPARSGINIALTSNTCYGTKKTIGKAFFVLDVDGDGVLDIVTTVRPAYSYNPASGDPTPTGDTLCAGMTCTHVYLGKADRSGGFNELTTTNLANHSVYADPPVGSARSAVFKSNTVDVDGDGLTDLSVSTGVWHSNGNGDFIPFNGYASPCTNPIDFNGDGSADCLVASASGASGNTLTTATGGSAAVATPNFNLISKGQELTTPTSGGPVLESVVVDFNGDGRGDILRWSDNTTLNQLFLSNGDGSFTSSLTFNLKDTDVSSAENQLKKSDGSFDFLVGDFTGHGNAEILRLSSATSSSVASGLRNRLFTKVVSTPLDQLTAAVTGTGATTSLYYVPLTAPNPTYLTTTNFGARYTSDRGTGNAATSGQLDVIFPMYVVATSISDNGVSGGTATEYSYLGLKADTNGRGLLGFREVRRQGLAPDLNGTPLTVFTQSLQTHPYIGAAARTDTRLGRVNDTSAQLLSSTVNAYCDLTAGSGADATAISSATAAAQPGSTSVGAPCATTAKLRRPYLLWTQESGTDLANNALPTVTTQNTFQASGDPSVIVVTTTGNVAGSRQTFVKTTSNTYQADNTANDSWVLGRLTGATVRSTVPNLLASLSTSPGNAPNASATQGTAPLPPPLPMTAAQLMPILQLLLLDD